MRSKMQDCAQPAKFSVLSGRLAAIGARLVWPIFGLEGVRPGGGEREDSAEIGWVAMNLSGVGATLVFFKKGR